MRLERPRVRRKGGGEIRLESYAWAQQEDSLNEAVLARLLHGVATRSYAATLEDVGEVESFGTSKSRVGARFIRQMEAKLREHLSRRLDDLTVVALVVDGVRIDEWTVVVVLGVDTEGRKHVPGLREGATENEAVCRSVLEDVVERGLCYEHGLLVVIDGAKAPRAAVRAVFGRHAVVQRCTVHKKRNVPDHLPESEKRWVGRKLTQAYREPDYAEAKAALERLAEQLEVQHPGAAASLREGLEETLTLHRLGIPGLLRTSLRSTNLCEQKALGMRKARVLHVLPNFGLGGAERMVTHLLLHLDRSRYEVAAVSLFDRQGTDLETMLDQRGVRVWSLGKRKGFDARMYGHLVGVFREFQPDVVHTHQYVLRYLLPLIVARRARAWVHTVHSVAEKEVDWVGKWVHRVAFRVGVVPVAIAEEVARSLDRVYGLRNLPMIPNGIPVANYALGEQAWKAWRTREGYEDSAVLFVSVARMSPPKDHLSLIQAFSIATSRNNRLRLLLVGDGPLRPELEARVRALGLQGKVRFLGVRADVPEVLAAADAFVLSSRWEGNPLSVMEAMAAGKPVIATAVGGVPELVQDGVSGVLVPPENVEALAQAILKLAGDADLRRQLGQQAFRRAKEHFDVSVMVQAYGALYERLLGKS